MSEPKSYNISTMAGIASIPADRFGVFLEELPFVVTQVRAVLDFQRSMFAATGEEPTEADLMKVIANILWVDDDLGNVDTTVTLCSGGEDREILNSHFNLRTGKGTVEVDVG